MTKTFVIGPFLMSYPSVFAKNVYEGNEGKYQFHAVLTEDKDVKRIKAEVEKAAAEKWGSDTPRNLKTPLNDGDTKNDAHFHGRQYVIPKANFKKHVVNAEGEEIIDADEVYTGCMCKAVVQAIAYDNKSKGVSLWFEAVQKVADGDRLGNSGMTFDQAVEAFKE